MTAVRPPASENAYLLALDFAELWDLVFADTPAVAEQYQRSWALRMEQYGELDRSIGTLTSIAQTRLGGRGLDGWQAELGLQRARVRQLLDQSSENAAGWAGAAAALREAQLAMTKLVPGLTRPPAASVEPAVRREAAQIAYRLAEEYSNLGLRILGPAPVGARSADSPRLLSGLGAALAATGVPVATRHSPRLTEVGQRPVDDQFRRPEDQTVRLSRDDGQRTVPATRPSPAVASTGWPVPGGEPPGTGAVPAVAVAARLVDRSRFIRVVADLIVEALAPRDAGVRLGRPAVLSIRATDGQDAAALLRTVRAQVSARLATTARGGAAVTLNVAGVTRPEQVWQAVADSVLAALPRRQPLLRRRLRRAVLVDGPATERITRLRAAVRRLAPPGWQPVLFIEGLVEGSLAAMNQLARVVLALAADDEAVATFVFAVDHPLGTVAEQTASGAAAPTALIRIASQGLDVPAPTLEDLDALRPGAPPMAGSSEIPVWAEAVGLEHDPLVWHTVRAELATERSQSQAAHMLWLWRLYLRAFETGPLTADDAAAHSRAVLALARVTSRWAAVRLAVPGLAGLRLLEVVDVAGSAAAGPAGNGDARVTELRSVLSAQPRCRSMAEQIY